MLRGDALIFYNAIEEQPDGVGAPTFAIDQCSRHAACPMYAGEKYIGNVWIHPTPVNEAMERCAPFTFDDEVHASCMKREVAAR